MARLRPFGRGALSKVGFICLSLFVLIAASSTRTTNAKEEIFLRELISNASDALDKIRLLNLKGAQSIDAAPEFNITIRADPENNVLHITDTGIGMTKDDLIKHLGTIAKSGTAEFIEQFAKSNDQANLIGQFGVGFYSSFLIADSVEVTTKHNDDPVQHVWTSDSTSGYSIRPDASAEVAPLGRGTRISLHLREDARAFLEEATLRDLVAKYSEFVHYPIYLWTTREEKPEEGDAAATDAEAKPEAEVTEKAEEEEQEDAELDPMFDADAEKSEPAKKTVSSYERLNISKPIWTRAPADVSEEEYNEFYKAFTKDSFTPMGHIHFSGEGEVDFKSLLYVPDQAPSELYSPEGLPSAIKLFVRRVFITDEITDLLPRYLRFVRGVVDADDLPLNVSRETLQHSRLMRLIRQRLTRKSLDLFRTLVENEKTSEKFIKEYSNAIKAGILEDQSNRKRLAKLLRFKTSSSDGKWRSLEDYVKDMKEKQTKIFFLAGSSMEEIKNSPLLERLVERGYEVLMLPEPIDEYAVSNLHEFEGHSFQNIAKDDLVFGDEDDASRTAEKQLEADFAGLTTFLGLILNDEVEKVRISNRLTNSPCALVASNFGLTGNMERIVRAQQAGGAGSAQDPLQQFFLSQKRIFEINPRHPIIVAMRERYRQRIENAPTAAPEQGSGASVTQMDTGDIVAAARVLYDAAALRSGYALKDTAGFASRLERIVHASLTAAAGETDPLTYMQETVVVGTDGEEPTFASDFRSEL
ncbi:hypothetical protein H696_03411 [Fonticula alba]|uniref:Histidine kinase/HSP90-like ATPase domain-containing protein n=1 Tax=Fonticula alba TaxID=691883 RepID=A0A058Z768_FONAL|nr:hypothetical protein H696_03411 [Fonticula alba]KCV69946.1 hypothetical protein H696_03411 [Fonticula alba]|eukprot:XP_009495552.1 hypothetical protein H696_03411 [Fonticula alba]